MRSLLFTLSLGSLISCGLEEEAEKPHTVRYEAVVSGGTPDEAGVSFTNETGEISSLDNVTFPWSLSFVAD